MSYITIVIELRNSILLLKKKNISLNSSTVRKEEIRDNLMNEQVLLC